MTKEVTESVTPMSGSSIIDMILSAHSFRTMPGYLRYNRSNVNAAFFLTKALEVLEKVRIMVNQKKKKKPRNAPNSR